MAGSSDYPRSHRVADFIQRELSGMIRTEVRDPRVSPMLTVSSVEVSRDLSVARVYWSVLDADEVAETAAALKRAAGFLRRRLAQEMQIRSVPELRFHHDDSIARGAAMSALIDEAVATNTTAPDGEREGASATGPDGDDRAGPTGDDPLGSSAADTPGEGAGAAEDGESASRDARVRAPDDPV